MNIDTAIRNLAFAEARSGGEALVMIAKHRAELDQALSEAKAAGAPSPEDRTADQFHAALLESRAHPAVAPKPVVDKTA